MKEDGHPANRIENVLSRHASLQQKNRARHWLLTPGRKPYTVE